MRIECPSCDATYEVPDHLLGGTRMLRCARCGHEWAPAGIAVPAAAEAADVPSPPVRPPDPAPERDLWADAQLRPDLDMDPPERGRALVVAAWVVSLVVLAGAVAAAYGYRDVVMQAWPPSTRVYAALGLADAR
jgi:predicted Zn finger-like uncharacterized protein